MKRRVVIVDADTPIYNAAAACETATPLLNPGEHIFSDDGMTIVTVGRDGGGPKVYDVDYDKGKRILYGIIQGIQSMTKADEVVMCLSNYDKPWRKAMMPWYKANRANMHKPRALGVLRQFVRENYRTFEKPSLEGDDVCGILLTMPDRPFQGEAILASADKDMRTLPGKHFHLRHRMEFEVSPDEADKWHMFQTLIGDITDNYKGCPGIGEKKAEKLLASGTNINEWWPLVVGAFQKAGVTEEYALLHAQVSRICRHTDWDFTKREVIPWQPPK